MLRFLAGYYEEIAFAAFFLFMVPILVMVNRPSGRRSRYWRPLSYVLIAISIAGVVAFCAVICIGRSEEGRWAVLDAKTPIAAYVGFVRGFPDSAHKADAEARIGKGQAEVVRRFEEAGADRAAAILYSGLKSQGPLSTLGIKIVGDRECLSYIHSDRGRYEKALNGFEDSAVAIVKEAAALFAPEIKEVRAEAGPWVESAPYAVVTVVLSYEVKRSAEYQQSGWSSGPVSYKFSGIGMAASWAIFFPQETEPRLTGTIPSFWPPASPHWEGGKFPETVIADIVTEGILTALRQAFTTELPQANDNASN